MRVVKELISKGSDLNARDSDGECLYEEPLITLRACAAGGRVFGMSVRLFVCLFVHRFLACSGITGLLELLFSFLQMALLNKLAFLSSTCESDHLEAQKKLLF